MLLRDPDQGIVYVFFDDNQAIYGRPVGLSGGLVNARIPEVWRNTSPIFDAVMAFIDQCTTAVTLGELVYGATKAGSARLADRVRQGVREALEVLPFDAPSAEVYGALRASLEADGKRLAEPDLWIASIALAYDLVLVTGNTRHFARIRDLALEDWLAG